MHLVKDKQATILAVFLVFAASASGQTERTFKFHGNGNLSQENITTTDHSIIINYSVPGLTIKDTSITNESFYRISIPGHIHSYDTGKPELPVFSRIISIPSGSDYRIKISEIQTTRLNPVGSKIKGILFPSQESETKQSRKTRPRFSYDKKIYASKSYIPSDTVRIIPLGMSRKNKLANLYVSPVRYNPRLNVIEVIISMKIEILFSDKGTSGILAHSDRALFNETLDKGVLNFNPQQMIPGYSEKPVKMIIITDPVFKKQLEPFYRWKTQKGFRLSIMYKGPNIDSYSHIKDTLTKIYNSGTVNDPPPEYLLIIGDGSRIPSHETGGSGNISDMYYGEFDGNGDYIPEMFVGRIPVSDTNDVKNVVKKIIQYEKFQFADTNKFYSRAIASAGYDAGYASYMNGQLKYACSNYLTKANGISAYHFNFPESLTAKDSVIKLIDKGVSFINYTGHGDASGWLNLDIKSPDIPTLDNKNMYPFVISNACRTADFALPGSMGNRMLLTSEKGAIGFIGCSNDSYWDEDYYWAVGPGNITDNPTYESSGLGAYDRLFHSHGEIPSDWYFTMGQINYAGNLAVSSSTSSRKQYYWETYNLIGDPSVIPIIGKPGTFSVTLPDTIPNGIKSLSLITDPFAYVAVSHFDTLWDASYASGSGSLTLTLPGLSNDSCLVIISGQNKVPVIKTIHISNVHKEFTNLSSFQLTDPDGNNDGRADFGESVRIKLGISNLGQTDAHNLYVKISQVNGLLTIVNDSVFIGDLSRGSEILNDKLSFKVPENITDLGNVVLKLTLKDQKTEKQYSYDICVHAPVLQIVSCTLDDKTEGNGNTIPDPGETLRLIFKVRNEGSSTINGQFNITGSNEEITIFEPTVKSGTLKFGELTEIPILVKLSSQLSTGSLVSVSSILDCAPYLVIKDFVFRIGKIRESFEASSFSVFPWINVSLVPWTVSYATSFDGDVAARSGSISDNGKTSLIIKTEYAIDDSLKFYYKTSSEPVYDFMSFSLNGTELLKKSGDVPWTKASFAVEKGFNVMEWRYTKDNSVSRGSDCAWIDMIDFAKSGKVNYIEKDLNVARIITPVIKDRFGQATVSVKVINSGRDTIKGFNLAYRINDHLTAQQFFKNNLYPSGDTVQVSFNERADIARPGSYNILAYGFNNNDEYTGNDSAKVSIQNDEISDSLIVYPNPFDNHFTIYVNSHLADRLQISIKNMAGVTIYSISKDVIPGKNLINITDFKASSSLYYLNIHGSVFDHTIRLVKINK